MTIYSQQNGDGSNNIDRLNQYKPKRSEGAPTQKSKKRVFLFRPKFFVVL
jgi:hypothetical protein